MDEALPSTWRIAHEKLSLTLAAAVLMSAVGAAAEPPVRDLRRAFPQTCFMVVHAKHNPERDFQKPYYEAVWKTVEETKIVEKALKIATSRMSQETSTRPSPCCRR